MIYVALLLSALPTLPVLPALPQDTTPPVLQFPEPGLDDPAAYQGYETRVFRDARRNALQVYLDRRTGRVVNLWADAADESVGLTVRDSSGRPAQLGWASSGSVAKAAGNARTVSYRLSLGSGPVRLGLFLLGSMRVERDFHYQDRDTLPLDAVAFVQPELNDLLTSLERLPAAERGRQLALLGAGTADELRARLEPAVARAAGGRSWSVRVSAVSFDGKHRLRLVLAGDTAESAVEVAGRVVTIRPRAARPVTIAVSVTTDAAALTPLTREQIFNDAFRRFAAAVRADTVHPLLTRRLEREVRGMELLCYGEKLMAGLPNYATYFGRDMLMTALLMQPVWAPSMPEHVIASALRKLSPDGQVSHEEALGGQAIRENAAEYNRLAAAGEVTKARALLANLDRTRENYIMVDDDYQFPVIVARYLADRRVPADRKRRFLGGEGRLSRLVANLAFVARQTEAYVHQPVPANLVSFPRAADGHWIGASWRDSRVGYGGGRFAMDVNVIWAPQALESIGTILDAFRELGLSPAIPSGPLATYQRDRAALARAVGTWRGAERLFQVVLPPQEAAHRVDARLSWLPQGEGDFWRQALRGETAPRDSLRFLALSLDGDGQPIPIVNTDPAMLLLLGPLSLERTRALVDPIMRSYPWGLFVDGLGPLTSNDTYAPQEVWEAFRRDAYHSPTVVWGRDVNILLAGLALQVRDAAPGADVSPLRAALRRTLDAAEQSGLRYAELWSYRVEAGRLVPTRYGISSDVQLWSLTDLVVQYLLSQETR
jgi:hypothetical protein